jgi:hypothetical protein
MTTALARDPDHPHPGPAAPSGGRKLIMTPGGVGAAAQKPSPDETLVRALVRADRWRRRVEIGRAKSITDLEQRASGTVVEACLASQRRSAWKSRLGLRPPPAAPPGHPCAETLGMPGRRWPACLSRTAHGATITALRALSSRLRPAHR